ncbi:MAG: DUF1292 domain-containing protein [Firmicutes bacterium]|nr:DUF1292 domain-containing protein [Bacillota bacterium]
MSKKKDEIEMEDDVTLLAQLLDENNTENVILFDEEGGEVELEQIAIVPVDDVVYAILRPLDADEDAAAVFQICVEDEDSLIQVEDEELASKILDIYNEQVGE